MSEYSFDSDEATRVARQMHDASATTRDAQDLIVYQNMADIPETANINRSLAAAANAINSNRKTYADWLENYAQRMDAAAHNTRAFDEALTTDLQGQASDMQSYTPPAPAAPGSGAKHHSLTN